MEDYSEKELFEEAAMVRDRLHAIEGIWDSQKVVAPGLGEVDVVGLGKKGKDAAIVQLFIRNGLMTGSKEFFLRDASDIPDDELIHAFIELLYSNQIVPAPLLLMPRKPSDDATLEQWLSSRRGRPVRIAVPERGQKRDLVKMAAKNAEFFIENYRQPDYETTVAELMKRFHLPAIPSVIGAFDISTIHGAHSIGAFICWEGGQFRKKLYRTVHIKSVSGVDDYAMMKETVQRVLRNLSEDLPDLLVIDGGKGQLESALKAIRELRPPRKPAVIAVAKEPDRAFTERGSRISLTDNRPSSLLLRQIRDEVHRFAITKHRKARTGKALSSVLDEVPGIGRKRRLALLKAFGSIDAIKKASVEDIWKLKGFNTSLARSIKDHIKK